MVESTIATGSILNSVKKVLGLDAEYKAFDEDVIMHINTTFMTLHQLGVGPEPAFHIEDESAIWDDFMQGNPNINGVKTYVALRVKLVFDPPATSFATAALEEQAKELAWRLNIQVERGEIQWPTSPATLMTS